MVDSSSFFWLGLVASLFIGLCITVCRTRNARFAAAQQVAATRAPLVKPELWEARVAADTALGTGEPGLRRWDEILPLSGRITMEESPPDVPRSSRWKRLHVFTRSRQKQRDHESQELPPRRAQLAMVILFPSQHPHAHHSDFEPPRREPPDFAIGTILYDTGNVLT